MKNSAIVRIVIWSAVIVLLIVAAVVMINGDSWGFSTGIGIGSGYRYPDSASYDIGDFSANADSVSSLDVEWISGSVNISEYDGDDIKVSEDGFEDVDTTMRYRIKDGKLSIRFCKSGWHSVSFGIGRKSLHKDLTILVPIGKQFKELEFDLVSSSLEVEDITTTSFDVETVSGSVNVYSMTVDDINIEGVSGSITLENISGKTVEVENVSGRIEYSGTVNEIDFNTVSGGITAEFDEAPKIVNIESVSGSSTIKMPKTGITARIDAVSGNVRAFGDKLGKSGSVTLGDGYMMLNVDTISGDVDIKEK